MGASCIHGDASRGTGILNNVRYLGRIVWGRTRWHRSAVDSSVRLQRLPDEPAIEYTDERLRIIPDELWKRVKARQRIVVTASQGVRDALRSREGRLARQLFTGLLKCNTCGSNFVRINQRDYRCATYTNGGSAACGNALKLNAVEAERLLLEQIETELLSPEAVEAAVAAYKDEAKRQRRDRPTKQAHAVASSAVTKKNGEIEQLKQMIRAGTMTATVLQPAIDAAERERDRLLAQVDVRQIADVLKVARMLPDAVGAYRDLVHQLRDARELLTDGEYAETRALVFEMLGGRVPVKARDDGSASLTIKMSMEPIMKSMRYNLVAGVGFEPTTFGL